MPYSYFYSIILGAPKILLTTGFNRYQLIFMSVAPKFEIYTDAAGKFRFRLKAPNGEIIVFSGAYESKDGCKNGIEALRVFVPKATIAEISR